MAKVVVRVLGPEATRYRGPTEVLCPTQRVAGKSPKEVRMANWLEQRFEMDTEKFS